MEIKDKVLYLVAAIVVMTGITLVALSGHRGARISVIPVITTIAATR